MRRCLVAILAATLLLTTHADRTAATERPLTLAELEQLVVAVSLSSDPAAAVADLSETRKREYMLYVTPIAFEGASSVTRQSAIGSASTAAADTCNTYHNWVRGQNAFGVTMWQFDHEVTWCWNGSYITNNPHTRSWASNICWGCGWSYQGLVFEARYPNDGFGQWVFTYQSQGHFRHSAGQSCYPSLRTEVYGNGSVLSSYSGGC